MNFKEIDRASLTIEQKLGMLMVADLTYHREELPLAEQMIREHRLGAVWIQP
jgi:hypothetical protein